LGYCVLQYSSSAHCDFSCRLSICATSDSPHASETEMGAGSNCRLLLLGSSALCGYTHRLHLCPPGLADLVSKVMGSSSTPLEPCKCLCMCGRGELNMFGKSLYTLKSPWFWK
jgi:hypothetical protein